jgi:AsmA-like C-terminal region
VMLKSVPVEKILVDFLCAGYAVTGPLDMNGALAMRPSGGLKTLSGRGQFRLGPGKIVGQQALALLGSVLRVGGAVSSALSGDVPAGATTSPLEFDSVTATYQITDGVASTRDLFYTSRAMKVAGRGTYALDTGTMNLDLDVDYGRGRVAARVTGTTASPSIRLLPSSVLSGVDSGKVESGLRDLLKQFGR